MKQIRLTEDEEMYLTNLVNRDLYDATVLTKNYADIMNSIWRKLTGKDHNQWLRRSDAEVQK